MAAATFDTLKFANTLKAAGVPAQQAEAEAMAVGEALQVNLKDLVTKDDLKAGLDGLRQEMRAQGDAGRQETKSVADALRAELKNQSDALRAELNALRADMKNQFDALRADMKNQFDAVRHEIKEGDQRIRSEQVLIRWIVGVALLSVVGLAFRFFAFRGVP